MFILNRIDICQFIYLIVNNFYCVINCLNMNHVTIRRAKCLGIVTLKVYRQVVFVITRRKKQKVPESENEAKQN